MKYVYYNRDTGHITGISPVIDISSEDLYIEIDDALGEQFLSGTKHPHQYLVTYRGELRAKFETSTQLNHVSVQDRIHVIPITHKAGDFVLKQSITNKTVQITLAPDARDWWKNNRYFGQQYYFIVACCPGDPHLVLWSWYFETEKLSRNSITYQYQGTDNIQFYTRKIFESYSHEQSN